MRTRFWTDAWIQDTPLKIQFPELFKMVFDALAKVVDCVENDTFGINFRRALTPLELRSYDELKILMSSVNLDNLDDEVHWALEKSRNFSTKSLYCFVLHGGIRSKICGRTWGCKVPQKIKIFLWQSFNDRLQTATMLKRRGWKGSELCCLVGISKLLSTSSSSVYCPTSHEVW